jgi:amino acid permease
MAVGPTLGTGLFIGAGEALAIGGPASLLISYVFLSLLTYFMATTVAEVAIYSPSRHGSPIQSRSRHCYPSLV